MSQQSFLVVDDDARFRERLSRALRERGYDVREAESPQVALALAREEAPELATVDLRMPGGSGLEVVQALKELEPATRIVVLTGYGSIATAVDAVKLGALNYLTKPATADDVLRALGAEPELEAGDSPLGAQASTPSLARVEWEHIHRVMQDHDGNVSAAARALGLHRRSLQRKLAKYPTSR